MEFLVEGYWLEVVGEGEETETEGHGSEVPGVETSPDGDDPAETADPDFVSVSEMLRSGVTPSPSPSASPDSTAASSEVVDYVPYLENISIQLGVIDMVLVLALLIFVIKQFVRIPR